MLGLNEELSYHFTLDVFSLVIGTGFLMTSGVGWLAEPWFRFRFSTKVLFFLAYRFQFNFTAFDLTLIESSLKLILRQFYISSI